MIIIEGSDGSGKTTLAKMLHSIFKIPYIHSLQKLPYNKDIAEERYNWYRLLLGVKIIMDRCYVISEAIHGPLLRGESLITEGQLNQFIKEMNYTAKVIYLFCDQTFEHKITKEVAEREIAAESKRDQIVIRYREIYRRMNCEKWHVRSIDDYREVFWTIRRVWNEC
ncbi:MAG: hypothetical protein ACTSPI_00555 [Candidatus Heimdallarchaeaceae archaeon]